MTWEELLEEAKKRKAMVFKDHRVGSKDPIEENKFYLNGLIYYKEGTVCVDYYDDGFEDSIPVTVAVQRSPDQQYQIMLATENQ